VEEEPVAVDVAAPPVPVPVPAPPTPQIPQPPVPVPMPSPLVAVLQVPLPTPAPGSVGSSSPLSVAPTGTSVVGAGLGRVEGGCSLADSLTSVVEDMSSSLSVGGRGC